MKVWKLKPIDLNHRDWEASTYRKEVVVRAESEDRAREIANRAFHKAAVRTLGETVKFSPWLQSALVSVVDVNDQSYPSAGSEEILGPQEALDYCNA